MTSTHSLSMKLVKINKEKQINNIKIKQDKIEKALEFINEKKKLGFHLHQNHEINVILYSLEKILAGGDD